MLMIKKSPPIAMKTRPNAPKSLLIVVEKEVPSAMTVGLINKNLFIRSFDFAWLEINQLNGDLTLPTLCLLDLF